MMRSELEVLSRAHQLFAGSTPPAGLDTGAANCDGLLDRAARINARGEPYQLAVQSAREALQSAAWTDAVVADVIAHARRDHARARHLTKSVLDEARADVVAAYDGPMAAREAMRRRVARLRAQRAHVLSARRRARRHEAALRTLRYWMAHRRSPGLSRSRLPVSTGRAGLAVRAALSRLGRPYVWGAAGPDRFDCSGLVQWCYAQAGIHLDRTTYQQIHDGIPVPRSQLRPGDLVFPHPGHVQIAIGNNLVVEAPYAGAAVRVSPVANNVQIRRPVL
ncbi:C40 family peptidase [Mycobacterium sp. SM1]|uniref:C40 family peptidase n=1 Tax=Mycobacterium sp. SM1 TaxID=2816243 RepID=UPI001BCCC84D|nr:C40 family peptidase [Mycobacterium sp. SM1]MBS4728089.1 C40 family peptidase [Mycobacterium sp. SM1]